jgi:hypothetical protein
MDKTLLTTDPEKKVLEHLVGAWNAFQSLDDQHPDDQAEFRHSLHHLQMMISWRVARRVDPLIWGSNSEETRDGTRDLA